MRALRPWLRTLVPPILLIVLGYFALREPITWWLRGGEIYDREIMKEWVREARVFSTLPELVKSYLDLVAQQNQLQEERIARGEKFESIKELELSQRLEIKREEIQQHLAAMGNPTRMYPGQLPLFPVLYRISVQFAKVPPVVWDSQLARESTQYRVLESEPIHPEATVTVQFNLHAYLQQQTKEREDATRRLLVSGLGLLFTILVGLWFFVSQRRERQRERDRLKAEQELVEAERLRLDEGTRRQDAERKHQEAERQNLELKSQMFANIGIMAGSYAHNIKNLLVRPNDLLRRCLDEPVDADAQAQMLREVKQTLGTVTERLQQILQTVRRDPSKSEKVDIDLQKMTAEMHRTWSELAREKWKLTLDLSAEYPGPLWIEGDISHIQQALENLLFNARDATFEMRNYYREEARKNGNRDAMITAAGWKGEVTLRTYRDGNTAVLEVRDNGIGMTEDVRRRCTETHFSTKRNNALFAGMSAGMGLGLSFVQVILEHHGAKLDIESKPHAGATFRVRFPSAD